MNKHVWIVGLAAVLVVTSLGCRAAREKREAQERLLATAQQAADAQELRLHHAPGPEPQYADNLDDLLRYEPTLTDDPTVTFEFGSVTGGEGLVVRRAGDAMHVRCPAADTCRFEELPK
jgi:type II secretory pathway pseudopilin PulG